MKKSLLEMRANVIKYIYKIELLNELPDATNAFESGDYSNTEIKIIEKIVKHYQTLKKIVMMNLKKTWSWHRISPLERSILIYGAYEISSHDAALVINELVILTQGYIPGNSYKFINATLENVSKQYKKGD